ncbi:hypothetical protein [Halobacillus sp. BBL2006]|uniref:hypothetical protein n=1 Tax=Halobacillus sp. BBL2006 TaxID=1543706 RepID=UPI000541FC43|nr:hypothetical protein [Halobacillus sp. BBL2006]KHE68295.1 hypothetical protein LD39_14935 [Halobacillus sp. BBL2006]
MNKQNQMFWILGIIGLCNLIASIILFLSIQNPMISGLLLVSGILLITGGYVDRKERIRRKEKDH